MRTYHPESWSVQARELADRIYNQLGEGENKYSLKEAENFFSNSYRHPLIRQRAAKRFGRLVRRNKNDKAIY